MKDGETFAVFNRRGEFTNSDLGELGLYHKGTRFLSRLVTLCGELPLIILSSDLSTSDGSLVTNFTNADLFREGKNSVPFGSLQIRETTFLEGCVLIRRIRITNYHSSPVRAAVIVCFRADYADIFEIRGLEREVRGVDYPPSTSEDRVTLSYMGLDRRKRETVIRIEPFPSKLRAAKATFNVAIEPQKETSYTLRIECRDEDDDPAAPATQVPCRLAGRTGPCELSSPDVRMSRWVGQATADLLSLTTLLPTGLYPYAGLPWFSAPFGRDGIFTALECLWAWPDLAKGVLSYLASTQANRVIPSQDAEPGKILHETRSGEMAATGEMPFAKYYGSVDATPLFVMLAGEYYGRTGDIDFIRALWPNVEAALSWIDGYGSHAGNGFVYYRNSSEALAHQGWKDSTGAICNSDGSPATGPLALCEVQGYVYGALIQSSKLAAALGFDRQSASMELRASKFREDFDKTFWCEDLATYALAINEAGDPCKVCTSNAGHCLFTGIAMPIRARRVVETLMDEHSFSGWGLRTMSSSEPNFNPMGYHTGCVWPHENSLIAMGFARYGFKDAALRLLEAQLDASSYFEQNQMPELFCGFTRENEVSPAQYPVACAPQAWAAASVFLFLQCSLGIEINGLEKNVLLRGPVLPAGISELSIRDLSVAGGTMDLQLVREGDSVSVNVLRNTSEAAVRLSRIHEIKRED